MNIANQTIRTPDNSPPKLIPVPKWNLYHDWPPQGGLRHLIFYAKTNGFDRVIKRAGRRVLIDESAFFQWVESNDNK